MLTWMYSKQFPEGKLFDTEGRQHPRPPSELEGWFDCRSKIHVTQDQLIDAIVRRELAAQPADRMKLEAEYRDKTGDTPHPLSKEKTLISVLDDCHARERPRAVKRGRG